MDTSVINEALQRNAAWLIFANVFMQQLGLPVPVIPTLLVAGSLIVSPGQASAWLGTAVVASALADCLWYWGGRSFGYRVLKGLCKLSINPGSCVSETESRFVRWGAWSLVVAKFVPGFSIVAPPIAGALRMPMARFLSAAAAGAVLWSGSALVLGWLMQAQVKQLMDGLTRNAGLAMLAVLLAFGAWLCWKLLKKFRFEQRARMEHVTPQELQAALSNGLPILFLDLRGPAVAAGTTPLLGATAVEHARVLEIVKAWQREHPIVTMCACPGDATAIQTAYELQQMGFLSVRPLRGGYEAWQAQIEAGEKADALAKQKSASNRG